MDASGPSAATTWSQCRLTVLKPARAARVSARLQMWAPCWMSSRPAAMRRSSVPAWRRSALRLPLSRWRSSSSSGGHFARAWPVPITFQVCRLPHAVLAALFNVARTSEGSSPSGFSPVSWSCRNARRSSALLHCPLAASSQARRSASMYSRSLRPDGSLVVFRAFAHSFSGQRIHCARSPNRRGDPCRQKVTWSGWSGVFVFWQRIDLSAPVTATSQRSSST